MSEWQKGKSANPGGRPHNPVRTAARKLAEGHVKEAIDTIHRLMASNDEDIALQAAESMLAHAGCAPPKVIELAASALGYVVNPAVAAMSTTELLALQAKAPGDGDN